MNIKNKIFILGVFVIIVSLIYGTNSIAKYSSATRDEMFDASENMTENSTQDIYKNEIMEHRNNVNSASAICYDNYIFFQEWSMFYKFDILTEELTAVFPIFANNMSIGNGYLYVVNGAAVDDKDVGNTIQRISIDKIINNESIYLNDFERLTDESAIIMYIYNDAIYYSTYNKADNKYYLKMMDMNGSNKETILVYEHDKEIWYHTFSFFIFKDNIYYRNPDDNGEFYKMSLKENRIYKISDKISSTYKEADTFIVDDTYIYYLDNLDDNKERRLFMYNKNTEDIELLVDEEVGYFNLEDETIYYTDWSDSSKLYSLDLKTNTIIAFDGIDIGEITILDEYIFTRHDYKMTSFNWFTKDGIKIDRFDDMVAEEEILNNSR